MTCVTAVVDKDGHIYMAADTGGSAGGIILARRDSKIFMVGNKMFGITSSFRMGNLLRYRLKAPKREKGQDAFEYMCTSFVDAVRKCLRKGGYAKISNNEETGGCFLVGYNGVIYEIDTDFQVGILGENYAAIGSGYELALGAMYAMQSIAPRNGAALALMGVQAACKFSTTVCEPINEMTLQAPPR